jgi:hypothetical protein
MDQRQRKIWMAVLLTAIAIGVLVTHRDRIRVNVGQRDYIQYWAGAKLLVHGGNPFDAERVLELEQNEGYTADRPVVIRTPPWSLPLFLPLGWMSAFWGWVLWMAASAAALWFAVRQCWALLGRTPESRSLCVVLGYTFPPVLACLLAAQIGLLLLLGIILFLMWEEKRPLAAGAALLLPFAKPHLLVFFWVGLAFWVVLQKRFKVAAGLVIATAAATLVALLFDHSAFQHYFEFLDSAAIQGEFIPTLSGVLRLLFFRNYFRMQFVPLALGLVWCVWFCVKNRKNWSWRDHGLTVMVVSILTTPYGWLTDEVVLLPAILVAAHAILGGKKKMGVGDRIAIGVFGLLNWIMLMLVALRIPLTIGIYFWSGTLWFAWYLYGLKRRESGDVPTAEVARA